MRPLPAAGRVQLQRPVLVGLIGDALEEFKLPVGVLTIELTESALMENVARVQDTLQEIRAMGVHLSLDDFGPGYSSLAYLKDFPLSKLKIDQAFIRGLPNGKDDAALALAIVQTGHQFGLAVAAAGAETEAQAEFLRSINCDELQGFAGTPCRGLCGGEVAPATLRIADSSAPYYPWERRWQTGSKGRPRAF